MNRREIAPGVMLGEVPGEKFKRSLMVVHLVLPSERATASPLALLPHVLQRRCRAIPDATRLTRRLFDLYGADLACDSYVAGPCRIFTVAVSGLKSGFALAGEDLERDYLELLGGILFDPYLEGGVFSPEDVAIERTKQIDYLKSEMNDKRSYCLRQARRLLLDDSVLGIESAGYLEEMAGVTPEAIHAAWGDLLSRAHIEVLVCGADAAKAEDALLGRLKGVRRSPVALPARMAAPLPQSFVQEGEAMDTAQGKICLMYTHGRVLGPREETVMRLANAVLGGLPSSRLFLNVREKQSLCYYCSSSYAALRGTLTLDSGVEHKNADLAAAAMQHELEQLQQTDVAKEELEYAQKAIHNAFGAARDNPDSLVNWEFNETLRGSNMSMDEVLAVVDAVTPGEIREALAAFRPAVRYTITSKEGA